MPGAPFALVSPWSSAERAGTAPLAAAATPQVHESCGVCYRALGRRCRGSTASAPLGPFAVTSEPPPRPTLAEWAGRLGLLAVAAVVYLGLPQLRHAGDLSGQHFAELAQAFLRGRLAIAITPQALANGLVVEELIPSPV